jgi:hypothetical protein
MNKLQKVVLYILGLGVPIFFLPGVFADAFGLSKFLFLLFGVLALFLLWAYQVYENNTIHWRSTPFDLAVFAVGASFAISTLIASPNKVNALTSANGSGVVILLVLFYFLIIQTGTGAALADGGIGTVFGAPGSPKSGRRIPTAANSSAIIGLTHAALLISLWAIVNLGLEFAKFKYIIPNVISFPATNVSPTGSLITQAAFLLIMLIYVVMPFMASKTKTSIPDAMNRITTNYLLHITYYLLPVFLLIGFLSTAYKLAGLNIFPLLPYRFGWAIAVDSFKNAPIFGIGPANFVSAFTRFKPIDINQTDYWNVTFGLSSNYYLHLLSTVGSLGLAAYLFLIWKVWKNRSEASQLTGTLLAIFALQLFIPFDLTLLFTEFALLALLGVATSGPAASIKLVAVKEGFVRMDTENKTVEQHWKEIDVEEE